MKKIFALSFYLISTATMANYFERYEVIDANTSNMYNCAKAMVRTQNTNFYKTYKKTHYVMFCTIISGLLNLGLNFLLIPKYGYVAAAVTTLLSYAVLMIMIIFISRKFFVWEFPFKTLGKALCASAFMGIIIYSIGNNLFPLGLGSLIFCIIQFNFIF